MSTVFWAPRLSLTVTLPMIGAPAAAVPEMTLDGWRYFLRRLRRQADRRRALLTAMAMADSLET
jgi:hypothetical protein